MVYTLLYQFGLFGAVLSVLAATTREVRWAPLAAGLGLILVDALATVWTPSIAHQPLPGLNWNWSGKLASIAISIAFLALFPSIRARCGLTPRQKPGSVLGSVLILAALAGLAAYLDHGTPKVAFSAETITFQALMPTISEELIYRGSLLVLMTMALPKVIGPGRFSAPAGVLATCAIFGIGHGVASDGARLIVSYEALIWTTIIGVGLTVLRRRSGSLVAPMIGHSLFNLISEGLPMFAAV